MTKFELKFELWDVFQFAFDKKVENHHKEWEREENREREWDRKKEVTASYR